MNKKNTMLVSGLIGLCVGACVAAIATAKYCKETIKKEVDEQLNKEVKKDILDKIDFDELNKEVKKEAVEKVADKINDINEKVDEKLEDFDERITKMEDIDAKKIDLAKYAIMGVVTISTTLIKSYYSNKQNNVVLDGDYVTQEDVIHLAGLVDDHFKPIFENIFGRLDNLEVK